MNARKAMEIKLEVMRLLSASNKLMDIYCPELPDEVEGEDIKGIFWGDFYNTVSSIISRMCDAEFVDKDAEFSGHDKFIMVSLASRSCDCPYCSAARSTEEDTLDCESCSYGKKYIRCDGSGSLWRRMQNRFSGPNFLGDDRSDFIGRRVEFNRLVFEYLDEATGRRRN